MNPIQLTEDCIIIEVPEDATDLMVTQQGKMMNMELPPALGYIIPCADETDNPLRVDELPPGNWSILTENSRQITEEKAKGVVEMQKTFGYRQYDAIPGDYQWCATPVQSFQSILKANNLDPEKRYCVLIKSIKHATERL
jgi:hypothetical protein